MTVYVTKPRVTLQDQLKQLEGTKTFDTLSITGSDANSVLFLNSDKRVIGDSDVISVDASGNVGTNTIAVKGGSTNSDFTISGQIALKRSNNNPFISFHSDSGGRQAYIQSISNTAFSIVNDQATPIIFQTNSTERVRIDASGNVGIGTSSPAYKLHVNSGATDIALFQGNVSGTCNFVIQNTFGANNGRGTNLEFKAGNGDIIGQIDSRHAGSTSDSSMFFRVEENDTTVPYVGLSGNNEQINLYKNTIFSGLLGIGTSGANAPITFASTTGRKIGFYQSVEGYSIGVESSNFKFVTDSSAVFTFCNGGTYATANEYMRIDSAGNVGIGTTTPASKLAVNGTITESTDGTNYYPVVTQQDIGTEPNEVPLNQYLGSLAYQNADSVNIFGGLVRGESGSVAAPNGVPVPFITLPNVSGGCWIVNIYISTASASTWSSTYLVNTQGTSLVITPLREGTGSGFALSNSGLTLLVNQSSGGGPFDVVWSTLRIL